MILLTAKADKQSLVEGLEAGADDYITKPFDRDETPEPFPQSRLPAWSSTAANCSKKRARGAGIALAQSNAGAYICYTCKNIATTNCSQSRCYITGHSRLVSAGICPHCITDIVKPEIEKLVLEGVESIAPAHCHGH